MAANDKLRREPGLEIVTPIPVLFLIGQSIELALKAYLLARGVTLRSLRRDYGHELHRSLRKAKEMGLDDVVSLSAQEETIIDLLDAHYSTKQLQYIVTGAKTFPLFGPLESVARKLVYGSAPIAGYPHRTKKNAP